MKTFLGILASVVLAGIFWLPSIVVHAIKRERFGLALADILFVTILPVAFAIATYYAALRIRALSGLKLQISLLLLLGVWLTGPFLIMVGATFTGGGYAQQGTLSYLLKSIYLFPAHTFMASTYDGTLGALLIVTVWLLCLFAVNVFRTLRERTQQRIPADG